MIAIRDCLAEIAILDDIAAHMTLHSFRSDPIVRQSRIGDVALVDLAGCEQSARRRKRPVQFVDDRGFADAGIAGDQRELRRAALDDAVEGGEQGADLEKLYERAREGISSRSGMSCWPSGKSPMRP
jgi:hypothetical protein